MVEVTTYSDFDLATKMAEAMNREALKGTKYLASRYQEQWAIEKQAEHSYWSFDKFV